MDVNYNTQSNLSIPLTDIKQYSDNYIIFSNGIILYYGNMEDMSNGDTSYGRVYSVSYKDNGTNASPRYLTSYSIEFPSIISYNNCTILGVSTEITKLSLKGESTGNYRYLPGAFSKYSENVTNKLISFQFSLSTGVSATINDGYISGYWIIIAKIN